ncbi:MAG: PAS domain S-box protein [Candidatus Omnitrophica bacterium]|nr:PAS domain S-box protein [Candidatus Omnitrophota bacterium]MBU1997513.1 PAS domain S-box protein [Candidatus Omnitrophota bacterium]
MRFKTKYVGISFLVFSFFLNLLSCHGSFAQNDLPKKYNVLVLESYHRTLSWTDSIDKSIEDYFRKSGQSVTFQIEYMDTKRFYDDQYKKQLFDIYKYKYKLNEFDLIISVDNNAFDFLVEYRNALFGKIPVVFCGVNDFKDSMLNGVELFTGTVEDIGFKETIDLALYLHPETKNIVIYETDTVTYKANKSSINRIEDGYKDRVKFSYVKNANIELIEEHAPTLKNGTLILIISSMKDASGTILSFEEYSYRTSKAAKVPLYSFWDFNIGHGVVGGKVISGKAQGETAARIALKILNGADPIKIEIIKKSPNTYMFDQEQLERFHIDASRLPEESIIMNRQERSYEKYYNVVFKILGVFVFLFILILLLIVDIEGRKRTEAVLRTSEKRFREIIESSSDWIWEVDSNGVYTYVSPMVKDILGYDPYEVMGKTSFDFMTDEEAERVFDVFDNIIKKKGNMESVESTCIHKNGQEVVLETNGVPILDNEGHLRGYRGVDRDITKRKKAENELRDSEEKFHKTFYTGSAAMIISELDTGEIIDVNGMFLESMRFEKNEVIGRTSKELGIFCDYSDREKMKNMMIENGFVRNLEIRVKTNKGEERLGLLSSDFIHIQDKKVLLTIVTDITELKRSQELMVQSEKMLSVGGLAAGIAHEINNPLAGILQNIQLIRNRFKKEKEKNADIANEFGLDLNALEEYMQKRDINKMMDLIVDSGKRAAKIVNNILSFSRKTEEDFGLNNIPKILDESIELASSDYDLKKKYDFKNIKIIRECQDEGCTLPCEGSQIQQVFFNILRNGAEAMKASVDPKFIIRMYHKHDMFVVEFEDNGTGLEENIARRVFEPFFTTKAVGEGTGLGLSVSYFIVVDKHNGKLEVESVLGKGTKFRVSLPKNHKKIS